MTDILLLLNLNTFKVEFTYKLNKPKISRSCSLKKKLKYSRIREQLFVDGKLGSIKAASK